MTVPHSMLDQSVLRSPICLGVIAKIRALFAYFGGTGGGISLLLRLAGGEAGIRTLGTGVSPYNGLANRRIRPLCHLSGLCGFSFYHVWGRGPYRFSRSAFYVPCLFSRCRLLYGLERAIRICSVGRTALWLSAEPPITALIRRMGLLLQPENVVLTATRFCHPLVV